MNEDGYTRGSPRSVEKEIKGQLRRCWNLNDVLRDLWLDTREEFTQTEMEEMTGWGQSSISRFEQDAPNASGNREDMRATIIQGLCQVRNETPLELFGAHPYYFDAYSGPETKVKDDLFRRFSEALKESEAHGLVSIVEESKSLGVFEQAIVAIATLVQAARLAAEHPRTRKKKSA